MPKGALTVHSLSNGGLAFKLGNFVLLKITHRQLNVLFVCLHTFRNRKPPSILRYSILGDISLVPWD